MKFSIIVPVYNVEKYIDKCLKSISNQSYNNYEVIVVNDGSLQNEDKIIKKYVNEHGFLYFKKENGGLSDARNYGIKKATGDYLLFVDSDDYIEKDLLKKLNKELENDLVDIIKFQINIVDEAGNIINKSTNNTFSNLTKTSSIKNLLLDEYIEPAWNFAYNMKFWKGNNFEYPKGKIHEDFGLTPLIFSKANTFKSINYNGYNYVQRENSIMNQTDYKKIKKRVNDFKELYLNTKSNLNLNNRSDKLIFGFCSLAVICKSRELNSNDRKEYIKFLKEEKVVKNIVPINFKRFLLKIYLLFFLDRYVEKLGKEYSNEQYRN